MDQHSASHKRRSPRSPVMLSAALELAEASHPVVLRNLSSGGALVEGDTPPGEGMRVHFVRNSLRVAGHIVWVEGRCAGIAFGRRLERAEVLRQSPKPRRPCDAPFRRPGLACRPLTDAERHIVERWGMPTRIHAD